MRAMRATVVIAAACVAVAACGANAERMRSWGLDLLGERRALLGARDAGPVHEAGYFRLNRTKEAEMFYFFFEHREMDPKAPLVLWMTGTCHRRRPRRACRATNAPARRWS